MTTIVYCHKSKTIAVDGRATSAGLIVSDTDEKWREDSNGRLWFMSGSVCDYQLLMDTFMFNVRSYGLKEIPDTIGFAVGGGNVVLHGVTDSGEAWSQHLTSSRCIGSGASFALAALDHDKTAEEAVAYAATRDVYTGGKISVYDVNTGKFLK